MERSFRSNSWSCGQARVRPRILGVLEWPAIAQVANGSPSQQDFQTIFPINRWIPLAKLLGCHCVSSSPAGPPIPPPQSTHTHETQVAAGGIWHGRLRSSSNLDLPSPAAIFGSCNLRCSFAIQFHRSRTMAPKRASAKAGTGASRSGSEGPVSPARSQASSSGSARDIVAMAASGESRANRVTSHIDELLAAQKRGREEKKRLASEMKNAKRRKGRLTKRARLLTTEDLLTVVALRETDRAAREHTSETDGGRNELVASEHSANEEGPDDAAGAGRAASPELQDAERARAASD